MSYWLYNGEKFPEPPVHDENEFPYMVITRSYNSDGTEYGTPQLYAFSSDMEFEYTDSTVIWAAAEAVYWWGDEENGWYDMADNPYTNNGEGVSMNLYMPFGVYEDPLFGANKKTVTIWSNFDIYNEDGSLYLAASDPVKLFDIKDWIIGQVIGMASKPVPYGGANDSEL